jgi:hypothetical protein
MESKTFRLQVGIFVPVRHPDELAIAAVAPCMIGAGQHLRAAAGAVHQPRPTVPAHVRESSSFSVVSANDDYALAEIVEAAPLARLVDLALVTDDLRRGAKERLLLRLEELRVEIEPSRQAEIVERRRALNGP